MKLFVALITLLTLSSCKPAQTPTASDVLAAALNATDAALAAAITNDTADAGADDRWESYVSVLEKAKTDLKAGTAVVCEVLPVVASVAQDIKCVACTAVINTATKEAKCQK